MPNITVGQRRNNLNIYAYIHVFELNMFDDTRVYYMIKGYASNYSCFTFMQLFTYEIGYSWLRDSSCQILLSYVNMTLHKNQWLKING